MHPENVGPDPRGGGFPMMQPMAGGALSSSVLVLNRFYMAVHVINVRRALALVFRELAEVIHLEEGQYANYDFHSWREISALKASLKEPHEDWIQAVNFELQVPRVIRLLSFDRIPRQTIRFNRRNLFARDGNQCQYCGRRFPTSELSLDHVVPRSRGGDTCWENIVCACVGCNVKKGGRTPHEAHMKLIRAPVKPKRSPLLTVKLGNPKYVSWKTFLDSAYWSVDLK
jgi:5-methylcytosine-specific restriction endonuclease McrA